MTSLDKSVSQLQKCLQAVEKVLPCTISHWLCQDSVGQGDIFLLPRVAQVVQLTAQNNLQAQSTDGGVHHHVTAQCQQYKVSLFNVLLEYLNTMIFLWKVTYTYNLQTAATSPGVSGIFVCCSESDGLLLFFLLLFFSCFLWSLGWGWFFVCGGIFVLGLLFCFVGGEGQDCVVLFGVFLVGFWLVLGWGGGILFWRVVLLWFSLHCEASYRLLLLFYFEGIFCPQVAGDLSSRSAEDVALWRVHRPWILKNVFL